MLGLGVSAVDVSPGQGKAEWGFSWSFHASSCVCGMVFTGGRGQ